MYITNEREKNIMKEDVTSFEKEENITFRMKKSDLKKLFRGNCNLNIKFQTIPELLEDSDLTKRELEVLKQLAKSKTNDQIATNLSVSKSTIKVHVKNIMKKLGVEDRLQAVVKAIEEKIISI